MYVYTDIAKTKKLFCASYAVVSKMVCYWYSNTLVNFNS